ncbi:hypothetical protein A3852_23185 [Rhodococcus qingshengii]|nr:hypothetical protein A3852_23185 [Rhodococcus qingshengii]
MAREYAVRLQPNVEPIDIGLTTVSDTADPPLGPDLDGPLLEVGCGLLTSSGAWVRPGCVCGVPGRGEGCQMATSVAVYLFLDAMVSASRMHACGCLGGPTAPSVSEQ